MGQTLEQFAQACRKALLDQPGPDGRKRVCDLPTADPQVFARQLARTEPLYADHSVAPLKAQ